MKTINLICDGDDLNPVRLCQGGGIELCSENDYKKLENHKKFIAMFKENKLKDHFTIVSFIFSLRQVKEDMPLLSVLDYFFFHRAHNIYLEIVE
jgi:hypothetical protein